MGNLKLTEEGRDERRQKEREKKSEEGQGDWVGKEHREEGTRKGKGLEYDLHV